MLKIRFNVNCSELVIASVGGGRRVYEPRFLSLLAFPSLSLRSGSWPRVPAMMGRYIAGGRGKVLIHHTSCSNVLHKLNACMLYTRSNLPHIAYLYRHANSFTWRS